MRIVSHRHGDELQITDSEVHRQGSNIDEQHTIASFKPNLHIDEKNMYDDPFN